MCSPKAHVTPQRRPFRVLSGTVCSILTFAALDPSTLWADAEGRILWNLKAVQVPAEWGRIIEAWHPAGCAKGLVIHIQDVHAQPHVQANIRRLVEYLHETQGVHLVAVEGLPSAGGALALDSSGAAGLQGQSVQDSALAALTLYEADGMQPVERLTFWGIEDPALYEQHLNAYREGLSGEAEARATLQALQQSVEGLKADYYPPGLQRLLALHAAYQQGGEEAVRDYVIALWQAAESAALERVHLKNLAAVHTAYQNHRHINMQAVEQQHYRLIQDLQARLKPGEAARLRTCQGLARARRLAEVDYYQIVLHMAQAAGLAVPSAGHQRVLAWPAAARILPTFGQKSAYTDLAAYVAYLQLLHQVREDRLVGELTALHGVVEAAYLQSPAQRAVGRLDKRLSLIERLFELRMTPADVEEYLNHYAELTPDQLLVDFKRLGLALPACFSAVEGLFRVLHKKQAFYELAKQRDEVIVDNVSAKLSQQPLPACVLITGGFHTPGILSRLKQHEVAFVVISPAGA